MVETRFSGIIHHVASSTQEEIAHSNAVNISGTPDSLARSIAERAISADETTFVGISEVGFQEESTSIVRAILVFPLKTPASLDDHPDDRQCVIEYALGHVLRGHTAGVFVSTPQLGC
ncbi:MAG: hypothetical protein RLZZ455_222 [Candidatus Parcubacteria bacterium]|jgi:hypothetical protein